MAMHTGGGSLSTIGRILGYSSHAASQRVKRGRLALSRLQGRSRQRIEGPTGRQPAEVREADGSRWVDFKAGDRSEGSFLRLEDRLPEAGLYRSDVYQVYAGWIPPERHAAGKGGGVDWNEGSLPVWRGKPYRLTRRTKGHAKSIDMLVYSLALTCWRQGAKLNIFSTLRMPGVDFGGEHQGHSPIIPAEEFY